MRKIINQPYTKNGGSEHERIFGKRVTPKCSHASVKENQFHAMYSTMKHRQLVTEAVCTLCNKVLNTKSEDAPEEEE